MTACHARRRRTWAKGICRRGGERSAGTAGHLAVNGEGRVQEHCCAGGVQEAAAAKVWAWLHADAPSSSNNGRYRESVAGGRRSERVPRTGDGVQLCFPTVTVDCCYHRQHTPLRHWRGMSRQTPQAARASCCYYAHGKHPCAAPGPPPAMPGGGACRPIPFAGREMYGASPVRETTAFNHVRHPFG